MTETVMMSWIGDLRFTVISSTREHQTFLITPEQESEWMAYWSRRSPDEVANGQEQMDTFRKFADEFLLLMRRGRAKHA